MSTAPDEVSGAFSIRPWQKGFWKMLEKPKITLARSSKMLDRDLDLMNGFWIVSNRCKTFLESIDQLAFEFLECECSDESGLFLENRWICAIVRVVDALDEVKTNVSIKDDPLWHNTYFISTYDNIYFNEDEIPSDCRIFKMAHLPQYIIADSIFYKSLKGENIKNFAFQDVVKRNI